MPYNTRRVSLSLPSLGIQLPGTNSSSRASQHHHAASNTVKSPASTAAATAAASPASTTATAPAAPKLKSSTESPPAAKRVKRSHTLNSIESPTAPSKSPISLPSRSRKPSSASNSLKHHQQQQLQQQRIALLGTPPPSPHPFESTSKLDLQGINDDVVIAVLQQLEATGNRPHLIKELAAVLVTTLSTVETSQNPVAIISSRLTNYLKRPWTALAPCPLAKEQVTVHPRRVYYYLTNRPRQEIPEYADNPMTGRHIISPSVSSGPDEEEDLQSRMLDARSPSPEVDFSTSDEPDDFDHISALNGMNFSDDTYRGINRLPHNSSRLASPPLEYDEREFTQTASVMQERKRSEQAAKEQRDQLLQLQQEQKLALLAAENDDSSQDGDVSMSSKDTPSATETDQADDNEVEEDVGDATDLPTHTDRDDHDNYNESSVSFIFGQVNQHLLPPTYVSSPFLRPQGPQGALSINTAAPSTPKKPFSTAEVGPVTLYDVDVEHGDLSDTFGAWGELKSPENVELAELDDMFGGF